MSWKLFLLTETGERVTREGVTSPLYLEADTGRKVTLREVPYGAVFVSSEPHLSQHKGPDGLALLVKIPSYPDPEPGDQAHSYSLWQVDGPSFKDGKAGPGWTRTGAIPGGLTVHPSISLNPPNGFHGWIKNGRLYDHREKLPE
jgi:hypothetical protein